MKILLLVYILILPINPLLAEAYIAGYPLMTWYSLLIFAIAFVYVVLDIIRFGGKVSGDQIIEFLLLLSFFITFVYSVFMGWNISKILTNSLMYYLPLFIYGIIKQLDISLKKVICFTSVGIIVAAFISLLIAFGILSSKTNTGVSTTDSLLYNFNYVDGSSGIFALLLCVYLLTNNDREKIKLGILNGVCGLVIVIFNQSRGYIITAIISVVLMIFLVLKSFNNGEGVKMLFRIVFVVLAITVVVAVTDNPLKNYIEKIFLRVSATLLTDQNLTYRFSEMEEYWRLFLKSPFVGDGWGLINNKPLISSYTTRYRAHNMYFGVLACTGLAFTPIFLFSLVRILKQCHKMAKRLKSFDFSLATCCVLSALLLGVANAGFGNSFCLVFTIVPFIVRKNSGWRFRLSSATVLRKPSHSFH